MFSRHRKAKVMVKQVPLSKGAYALVDDEDYALIMQYKWQLGGSGSGYAQSTINRRTVLMHRMITGASDEYVVDHINHNGLDNRRENLRVCTQSENQANRRKGEGNSTSIYKGVYYRKDVDRWMAYINNRKKMHYLGYYESEIDAAAAYNRAAREIYGEFALLNTIDMNVHPIRASRNRRKSSSQYRGVSWRHRDKKWYVRIRVEGKRYHIGTYPDEMQAALAYNRKAIELLGDKAILNIIEQEAVAA